MTQNRTFNIDSLLIMKDAYLDASSAAAYVSSSEKVIDLGGGYTEGVIVIDISAIEIASDTEIYTLILEGSSTSDISTTVVPLAVMLVGANEVIVGESDVDTTVGRHIMPFSNMRDDVIYRYVRMYTVCAGTITTNGGINYSAYMSKKIGGG